MNLISNTMVHYLLKGKRNLSIEKAKLLGKRTGTDPLVWVDPARTPERRPAWEKTFNKKREASK